MKYNPKCATKEEFEKYLSSKKDLIKIEFFHINNLINPDNLKNPSWSFIDNSFFIEINPKTLLINADIYFR